MINSNKVKGQDKATMRSKHFSLAQSAIEDR